MCCGLFPTFISLLWTSWLYSEAPSLHGANKRIKDWFKSAPPIAGADPGLGFWQGFTSTSGTQGATCRHQHLDIYIDKDMDIYIYIHIYIKNIYVYTHIRVCIHIYMCMYTCIYICIIQIYMYINIYTDILQYSLHFYSYLHFSTYFMQTFFYERKITRGIVRHEVTEPCPKLTMKNTCFDRCNKSY